MPKYDNIIHRVNKANFIQNSSSVWFIFLLWPFLGFIYACYNFRYNFSRHIVLAFFAIYGLLFYLNPEMDAQRRAYQLKEIYNDPIDILFESISKLYDQSVDIVEPILMYLVSRFTNFHGFLFLIYALVFGYLMLFYVKIIYKDFQVNSNINSYIFFILLLAINPINEINGFRMWFAGWVYVLGFLLYIKSNKKKYILFSIFSIFIHFSYIPAIFVFFVYLFLGNRIVFYGLLSISTFFISELNINLFISYSSLFGEAIETKAIAYGSDFNINQLAESASNSAWFVSLRYAGIKYFTLVSLLFVYYKTRGNFKNKFLRDYYSYTLLFLSFSNLSSLFPSGGRFFQIFYIFAFTSMLLYFVYEYPLMKIHILNVLFFPIIGLFLLFAFRMFSETASIYLLGPSFGYYFAFIENISMKSIFFD